MFEPVPIVKLLMHADHEGSISYAALNRWADEFGVDVPDVFKGDDPQLCDRAASYAPSPRGDRPLAFLFEVVAHAYAQSWINLEGVLLWAEERELEDDELIVLLERCATEGHSNPAQAA
jgi:hypothetical protein